MNWHPSRDQLEAFLDGEIPIAEMPALLAHLARDCPRCMDRLVRLAEGDPLPEDRAAAELVEAELPPELEAAYDQAFDRAIARAKGAFQHLEQERAAAASVLAESPEGQPVEDLLLGCDERLGGWVLIESLLDRSFELRFREPRRMLLLAQLAQIAADNLSHDRYGEGPVRDLQARAWAELANAYRVGDDLAAAREAMAVAVRRCRAGSGDPLLLARILSLTATLRSSEGMHQEAIALLDETYRLYATYGEPHLAGQSLLVKAAVVLGSGEPEQAISLLRQGLGLMEVEREPQLVLASLHNMVDALSRCGRFREARHLIWRTGLHTLMAADPIGRLKLQWVEGRINAGLGRLDQAEAALSQVRQEFGLAGLPLKQAMASLELARVRLKLGRTEEVEPLVEEMVTTFSALGLRREAVAALRLLA